MLELNKTNHKSMNLSAHPFGIYCFSEINRPLPFYYTIGRKEREREKKRIEKKRSDFGILGGLRRIQNNVEEGEGREKGVGG